MYLFSHFFCIISLKGEIWVDKLMYNPAISIEVPAPSQENERVSDVDFDSVSIISRWILKLF